MINDWKELFSTNGFEKTGRREFFHHSAPVSSIVYEIPLRVGEREVRIQAGVTIQDPWAREREYQGIDLSGDVTSEGIFVHYDPSPCWLHPDEAEPVFAVVKQCLIGWVEHWSDPHWLIRYLENPVDIVMTRPAGTGKMCEHIAGVPAKKRCAPATDHQLSLLYYHTGDFEKALAAAERYLHFVEKGIVLENEPQRTKRQIDELVSKTSGRR